MDGEKFTGVPYCVDFGGGLNFGIWKFDLKLAVAGHYNVLKTYIHRKEVSTYSSRLISKDAKPYRWFVTLSGGLAYNF